MVGLLRRPDAAVYRQSTTHGPEERDGKEIRASDWCLRDLIRPQNRNAFAPGATEQLTGKEILAGFRPPRPHRRVGARRGRLGRNPRPETPEPRRHCE